MKIGDHLRKWLGIDKRLERIQTRQRILETHLEHITCLYLSEKNADAVEQPTIMPNLSGGLGNQLFQIAAAYAVARRVGSRLAINYNRHTSAGQGNHPSKYRDTLYRKIDVTEEWPILVYRYPEFIYNPLMPVRNAVLDGFFQSGKYFRDVADEVRQLFEFPKEIVAGAQRVLAQDPRPAVGVHIRLGDYLSNSNKSSLHVCTRYYYQKTIRRYPPDKYRIIVCSDDHAIAKKLVRGLKVEFYAGADDLAEMTLLSQCEQLIISNSSFSWWSAFLGVKKKMVFAPNRWFAHDVHPTDEDMYETGWKRHPIRPRRMSWDRVKYFFR